MDRYPNTEENARKIGWILFPEYCIGDPSLPFVVHDYKRGLFFYSY